MSSDVCALLDVQRKHSAVTASKMHLEGGKVQSFPVFYNEGVADADVQPEVGCMVAKQSIICTCSKE